MFRNATSFAKKKGVRFFSQTAGTSSVLSASNTTKLGALVTSAVIGYAVYDSQQENATSSWLSDKLNKKSAVAVDPHHPGAWSLNNNEPLSRPDLPTITLEELSQHYDESTLVWVSYKGAVYDITPFLMGHPGGLGRLLMAGGRDLEPFWDTYRLHYRGHIVGLLEKYRIGNLSPEDAIKSRSFEFGDPFEEDPPRNNALPPTTHKPFCGEARTDLMTGSYYTPNELFYTRNHMNVPNLDPEEYELTIEGVGIKTRVFKLAELKKLFPAYEVVTTIQCAGNRMEDYHGIAKGSSKACYMSPHWSAGAISNAKWTGVRMRDVLAYCGVPVDDMALGKVYKPDNFHVVFKAYDADETGGQYHASCPMDKIIDPWGDCLLAFEMNDRILPRDHGYPVRAIVPGHAGARQPKWLTQMTIMPKAWPVFQCTAFAPDVTFEDEDGLANWPPKSYATLENNGLQRTHSGQTTAKGNNEVQQDNVVREMPVQSLVCEPAQNATLSTDMKSVTVKGIAWSGGGSGIKRVDVSIDGGKNFTSAELYKPVIQHPRGQWGWTQFSRKIDLTDDMKAKLAKGEKLDLEITSKAADGHWNVQPEFPDSYINPRGVAINHWYRVACTVDPNASVSVNPMEKDTENETFANRPSGGKFRIPFNEAGWKNSGNKKFDGESWKDWHKVADDVNTVGEPGIKKDIDWAHYRNLESKPFYQTGDKKHQWAKDPRA